MQNSQCQRFFPTVGGGIRFLSHGKTDGGSRPAALPERSPRASLTAAAVPRAGRSQSGDVALKGAAQASEEPSETHQGHASPWRRCRGRCGGCPVEDARSSWSRRGARREAAALPAAKRGAFGSGTGRRCCIQTWDRGLLELPGPHRCPPRHARVAGTRRGDDRGYSPRLVERGAGRGGEADLKLE